MEKLVYFAFCHTVPLWGTMTMTPTPFRGEAQMRVLTVLTCQPLQWVLVSQG